MKPAPALILASLILVTTAHAAPDAGPQSVGAAQKALESARADVAKAVQRIQADPPSTADLDAAHAAVGGLKDVIDTGAAYEQDDLEYAKAALAARKELRAQREYVDMRRAKVHIFNHRRVIDEALARLKEAAKPLEAKEPSAKDFDDARAAARVVKTAADEARPFGGQDAAFATYLGQADATVAKLLKAADEKSILLSADKHQALVEESRGALSTAMAALGKGATDAQFDTADKAVTSLTKRLEEGKILEGKEKTYRAYADKTRAEARDARKKMDELWSATGLARLKAEIEPAQKDLATAARGVRGKKATADQLAEARTAAIVVRKLVEKFAPEAARSAAFGQYVLEVKGLLIEVEVQVQLRAIEAAQRDINQALKTIARRDPTDEQFEEANSAVLVLEKTLEGVHGKEPAMAATFLESKGIVRDARASVGKRRTEVEIERQKKKVEDARKEAATQMTAISQASVTAERIQEAEASVNQLRLVLEAGVALTRKDREYNAYDKEVKKRIAELNAQIAGRKLFLSASEGKAALTAALAATRSKIDAARQPATTDAELEEAGKTLDAAIKEIEARAALEQQDKGYAAHAEKIRNALVAQQEALEFAKQARELRKKTGEALSAGLAASTAAGSGDLRSQKTQHEKALAQYKACKEEGAGIVEGNPALARVVVLVDGAPRTPKEVISQCAQKAEATTVLMKPLIALIAFDEGPKRAYEKAKALLAKGNKAEALAQFDECTATGVTLQYRNPELKDREFEVAGLNISLAELNRQCTAQSKTLRAK